VIFLFPSCSLLCILFPVYFSFPVVELILISYFACSLVFQAPPSSFLKHFLLFTLYVSFFYLSLAGIGPLLGAT
jgi:hypothetical protein